MDAFAKLASSPQQRTVIVPADFASLAGTLGGVAELAKTLGVAPPAGPVSPAPKGRAKGGAVPPTSDSAPPPVSVPGEG